MGEFLPKTASLEEYWSCFEEGTTPPESLVVANELITVDNQTIQGNTFSFAIDVDQKTDFTLNHYYFPGWVAQVDNLTIVPNKKLQTYNGRMSIPVESGKHTINFTFTKTLVRKITSIISLTTAVSFAFLLLIKYRRNYETK